MESLKKKKARKFLNVQIADGQVVIDDSTHSDEYQILLFALSQCGLKQEIKTESWCG